MSELIILLTHSHEECDFKRAKIGWRKPDPDPGER